MHGSIEPALRAAVAVVCCTLAGCERRTAGQPWVIPGPTVPGVVLREPFVWDTRAELEAWTENGVSRGTFQIDDEGSNGAIAIEFGAGQYVMLRGPNLDPPLQRVRAVRIRYKWSPSGSRKIGELAARFDAVNSPRVDLQLHAFADLREGSTWIETELKVPSYAGTYTPLDVNYIYLEGDAWSNEGVLKIDAIALLTEP